MSNYTIITIGREFGSGGREVGMQLAKKLGIKCYDKEIIAEVAKETDFNEEFIEQNDEKKPDLWNLIPSMTINSGEYQSPELKIFMAQFAVIKKIASRESCVLIGRCSDYILNENKNLLKVFIYADKKTREERVSKYENIDIKTAHNRLLKEDKRRAFYYEYYTDQKWGDMHFYDLCINTTATTIEGAVQIILDTIEAKNKKVK